MEVKASLIEPGIYCKSINPAYIDRQGQVQVPVDTSADAS